MSSTSENQQDTKITKNHEKSSKSKRKVKVKGKSQKKKSSPVSQHSPKNKSQKHTKSSTSDPDDLSFDDDDNNNTCPRVNPIKETTRFESITQLDQSFEAFCTNYPGSKLGFAAPFFAILTVHNFMNGKEPTSERHNNNVESAVITSLMAAMKEKVDMSTALQYLSLCGSPRPEIKTTTIHMISSKEVRLRHIIPTPTHDGYEKFGLIFLKNSNFFCVLGSYDKKTNSASYHLRDSRSAIQYDFYNKFDLIDHLCDCYCFDKPYISNTGQMILTYSVIEYTFIAKQILYDPNVITQKIQQDRKIQELRMAQEAHFASQRTSAQNYRMNGTSNWLNNPANFGDSFTNPDAYVRNHDNNDRVVGFADDTGYHSSNSYDSNGSNHRSNEDNDSDPYWSDSPPESLFMSRLH